MTIKKTLLILVCASLYAQGDVKINTDIYFDYFYNSNKMSANNDLDGFALRRVYLTFNKELSDKFSARIRFESDSKTFSGTSSEITPFVKDLYVKYKASDDFSATVGMQGHPILKNYEKFYGLRYVEKSPNDLYKFNSSRDMGISGEFKLSKELKLTGLIGNGEGNKSESNKGGQYVSTLAYTTDNILVEAGGFTVTEDGKGNKINGLQMLLGYEMDNFQIMLSGHLHESIIIASDAVTQMKVASVFLAYKTEESKLFFRGDFVSNGITKADPSYIEILPNQQFNYFLVGFEYKPESFLYITPNVSFVTYDESKLESSSVYRVTFRLKW